MSKADLHVKMESNLVDAIRRYAEGNGLNFTGALSTLAAQGLRAQGITLDRTAAPAGN